MGKDKTLQPVFIIGAARSGTKFLRSCLAASREVASIPYDINYIWRYGSEEMHHDELLSENLSEKKSKYITKSLFRLADTESKNCRFLVEKTVSNTLRVSYIYKIFPNAKFIHLTRDGRAVIESSIRQWREPVDKGYLVKKLRYFPWTNYRYAWWFLKNLIQSRFSKLPPVWGPRYQGIQEDLLSLSVEEVCAKQWSRCVDLADTQLDEINPNQVYRVTFENLMSDPQTLKGLCEFIGISDREHVIDYFTKTVSPNNNQKSLNQLDKNSMLVIDKYASSTLKRLEYI